MSRRDHFDAGHGNPAHVQKTGYRTEHNKWWGLENHRNEELDKGNEFPDISEYPEHEAIWVTHTPASAERYGDPDQVREVDLSGATPLVDDGDDGYLYVRPKNR
jgi:hypothetical protein